MNYINNYDGLQEFCKPPNKLQTRNTFITSSPRWLITLMAILPFLGLSKERLVSLLRVALGRASHRDTKTRGKKRVGGVSLRGNAEVPLGPSAQRYQREHWRTSGIRMPSNASTPSIYAVSWRSPLRSPAFGKSLSQRHKDTEKSSRPERRRPRRHQHLIARQVWQLGNSAKKCVNTRDPSDKNNK